MSAQIDHILATTFHGRKGAIANHFRYSADYVIFDAEAQLKTPFLFGRNKTRLLTIRDQDHGGLPGQGRGAFWVREMLARFDIDGIERIELIAQARIWGHVFNPVSFWLCWTSQNGLRAVIAEVSNTYGERHSYLIRHEDLSDIGPSDRLEAEKIFYVSPFQPVEGRYRFRFDINAARVGIWIDYASHGSGEPEGKAGGLLATLTGPRRRLSSAQILYAALRRPFGSRRVLLLIHWQALKLWRRKAKFRLRPSPPDQEIS